MEELVRTEPYRMKISTFYENYTDGKTRSVSLPIERVKIDVHKQAVKRSWV
jgi:hypothetical protein